MSQLNDVRPPDPGAYLFGRFRLDLKRRVLAHDGAAVPLRPTVFAVLLRLLENPGRLVSKDDLFDAVWPQRIVEEANLTQAVFTLRTALRDAGGANAETLIATVRGQGYRFTGDVRWEAGDVAAASDPRSASPTAPAGAHIPWRPIAVTAVILLAAGLGGVAFWKSPHPLRPGNTIVLSDFENRTRDPIFDRTLGGVLRVDLGQSPFIAVMPEKTAQDTLALMTRPRDTPLTPDLAQEVCVRANADGVLGGEIDAVGAQYIVTLAATDCSGRRVLAQEKAEVAAREAVAPTLDRLIGRIRNRLGEPIASVDRYNVPLAPAKTASLDALQAYSEGAWLNDHGRQAEAVPALKQAIDLDPQFAAAYATLGVAYASINADALADNAIAQAFALRNDLNEREKLRVEALYNLISKRDFIEAIRVLQRWTTVYPTDVRAWSNLANVEMVVGRYDQARQDAQRILALHPTQETLYVVAAQAALGAGHPEEARADSAQAIKQGLAGDAIHRELMEAAVLQRDAAALRREKQWAQSHPGEHTLITEAELAYGEGRVRDGDRIFDQLAAFSAERGLPAIAQAYRARLLADLGLAGRARALLATIKDESDRDFMFTQAEVGDPALADRLIQHSVRQRPTGTLVTAMSAPEARAALALRRHDAAAAVAALQPALAYQAADPDIPYVLGTACLAAGEGAQARVAFQTIRDHQGWNASSPLYPLAKLGLARALVLGHDLPGAKAAYGQFFAAWKDADHDVPILQAAKREAAALS